MKKSWLFIILIVLNMEVFAELTSLDEQALDEVIATDKPSKDFGAELSNVQSQLVGRELRLQNNMNDAILLNKFFPPVTDLSDFVTLDKLPPPPPATISTTTYYYGGAQ